MTDTPARQALPWVRGADPAPVDADSAVADPALWGAAEEAVDSRGLPAAEAVHDTTVKPPQTPPGPRWPTADRARPLASDQAGRRRSLRVAPRGDGEPSGQEASRWPAPTDLSRDDAPAPPGGPEHRPVEQVVPSTEPDPDDGRPAPSTPAPRHGGEIGREVLFRPAKRPPASGWRQAVHRWSRGAVNPGESAADVGHRELVARVNQPIRGDYKVAVLALKGGVGKTTVTVCLGSTFSSLRGDHVVAVDANPDRGTLASRIPVQTTATVRHLLNDADNIARYSDVRAYTSQAPSRLEVLASERDPHKAEAFSEADYRNTVRVLENFYNLILTDCGTGLTHGAMRGVLDTADALVLVSSPALDGAQSADATLTWLDAQGYGHLVERTVVVISSARPGANTVDLDQLVAHFDAKVRAVQVIPYDQHLAEGSEVDLNRLSPAARHAFVTLAALVAEDFPEAAGRHHGPIRPRS